MSNQVSVHTQDVTANGLRQHYNNILGRTEKASEQIGKKVKVVDMGDTQNKIEEAMVSIRRVTRKESKVHAWIGKYMPERFRNNVQDKIDAKSVEGKTVFEVSKNLIEAVTAKQSDVENVLDDLIELHDTMIQARVEFLAIVDGINEHFESFNQAEKIRMNGLKAEILHQIKTHEQNIISARGALQAAEGTVMKLSETLPNIRAQLNDSMAIRGALRELESLNEVCKTVTTISGAVQLENQEVMEEQLLTVLEQSVISDDEMQRISLISDRQAETHKRVNEKVAQIAHRRQEAINKLEGSNANFIENTTWAGQEVVAIENKAHDEM